MGLDQNHAFIDGNKRIGFAALVAFLDANGFQFICDQQDEIAMTRRAAASEITEEQWTVWIMKTAAPQTASSGSI